MKSLTGYNLGVLGLGEGRSVLCACDRSDRWKATCVCDLDESLCQQRVEEHKVDHCIQALNAGKHIICTKPLIDDLAKGWELLEEHGLEDLIEEN